MAGYASIKSPILSLRTTKKFFIVERSLFIQTCTLRTILPEYHELCITLADFLMSTIAIYPAPLIPLPVVI